MIQAVPKVGWPAKGTSCAGVKMRTSKPPSLSSPWSTNDVSEKFISRAMVCICSLVRSAASVTTAS
jgi:hypothetical protein